MKTSGTPITALTIGPDADVYANCCLKSPIVCGTSCVRGGYVHSSGMVYAGTCVCSSIICGISQIKGQDICATNILCGTTCLHVSGRSVFSDSTDAGAPSITFVGDLDTGFLREGANIIGISTGGVRRWSIGNGSMTSQITGGARIVQTNGTASIPAFSFNDDGDTGLYRGGANILSLATAGAHRMSIIADGNVGIGITNPGTALSVVGTVSAADSIFGAIMEHGLADPDIIDHEEGTVLVWEDGGLKPCEIEYDSRVMGISKKDHEAPIVIGAEPVLITGIITEGDFIVTSDKTGHGKKGVSNNMFGKVIAQALEDGEGDSYKVRAMIRKF